MRRNPEYWQVAALYGCVFGAMALVEPFLTPYLLSIGFSGAEVGNLTALSSLLGLVLAPALSSLADGTGRHKSLLVLSVLAHGVAFVGMSLRPALRVVAVWVVVTRFAGKMGMSLRDRLSLHWLGEGHSDAFGSLRLWGSVGFGLAAWIGGAVADQTGVELLLVVAGLLLIASLALMRPYAARLPTRADSPARREGPLSPAIRAILLTTLAVALARAAQIGWNLEFIEHDLGGGRSAVGLYSAIAALVEVPVMFSAERLMRRWGAATAWGTGMALWVVSWLLLSLTQTPTQAMLLAPLMGVAQGFALLAPVVLVGQVGQPHHTALNLSLVSVFNSLGTMVGSPVAGHLFDAFGVRALLQIGAGAMALAVLLLATQAGTLRRRPMVEGRVS